MALNKSKGNMYGWVGFTLNIIKGRCSHFCEYCYLLRPPFNPGKLRLDRKEFDIDLGKGKKIFIGSSTDVFAANIPEEWILEVLDYCSKFDNTYLFQSKNPMRFLDFLERFPEKTILGTTIETNRSTLTFSDAPEPAERAEAMSMLPGPKMVSIEPVLAFDVRALANLVLDCSPEFVSLGANSSVCCVKCGHKFTFKKNPVCSKCGGEITNEQKLGEPSAKELDELIILLEKKTKVILKDNLKRLQP